MYKNIIQLIKFGCVGISNNLIFFAIYYICLAFNVNYLTANIFAYSISSLSGYILNKIWVFRRNKEKTSRKIVKYYIIYGSAFLINVLSMYILVDILVISAIVAPIITMCITVPYNFVLNKLWIFKDNRKQHEN